MPKLLIICLRLNTEHFEVDCTVLCCAVLHMWDWRTGWLLLDGPLSSLNRMRMILTFTLNTTSGCLSTSGLIEINSIELIKQNIVEILIPVNSPSGGPPHCGAEDQS